ncbi:MAG: ribonuclease III [Actinomycetota bacterium]
MSDPITDIERALGVEIRDRGLLVLATTHRSYAYEQGGLPTNERLEFLGDAVLGLVITDLIYREFPDLPEGQLAKLRAAAVNMHTLADISRGLGVGDAVLLGKGEEQSGGRDKDSILADTLEALLGAIYLDRGLDYSSVIIRRLLVARIQAAAGGQALDYKTSLQELGAERGISPDYAIEEEGPDHAKRFTAILTFGDQAVGRGAGRSKKEAEQAAAKQAWDQLVTEALASG